MKADWMIREDRARSAGISLGVNWDVLSDMLAARSVSCEVPLAAFEFYPANDDLGVARRFVVHGVERI